MQRMKPIFDTSLLNTFYNFAKLGSAIERVDAQKKVKCDNLTIKGESVRYLE